MPDVLTPAVVAEDLAALADALPFDERTRRLLERAAELAEQLDAAREREAAVRTVCRDRWALGRNGERILAAAEVLAALGPEEDIAPPTAPSREAIGQAVASALDCAGLKIELWQQTEVGYEEVAAPSERLARVLDKAGLIDWSAFAAEAGAPAAEPEHRVTLHWDDDTGDVVMRECICGERWYHDEDSRCPEDDSDDEVAGAPAAEPAPAQFRAATDAVLRCLNPETAEVHPTRSSEWARYVADEVFRALAGAGAPEPEPAARPDHASLVAIARRVSREWAEGWGAVDGVVDDDLKTALNALDDLLDDAGFAPEPAQDDEPGATTC